MNYTQKLRDLGACDEAVSYAQRCESARIDTLNALWRSGRPDWILWLAARVLPGDRRVVRAASVCARAVLHLSREQDRPVLAQTLDLVDRWCAGESVSATELRASAAWAWATATEAASAAAWAEADDSIDFLAAIDSVLPLADVVAAFEVHR